MLISVSIESMDDIACLVNDGFFCLFARLGIYCNRYFRIKWKTNKPHRIVLKSNRKIVEQDNQRNYFWNINIGIPCITVKNSPDIILNINYTTNSLITS
jgi:hypothetical protein